MTDNVRHPVPTVHTCVQVRQDEWGRESSSFSSPSVSLIGVGDINLIGFDLSMTYL